uniref:Uncharacterized protein n=1 Tax=Pyxicephalus adspersus TaxID=30357 RepID=A0AAV2ZXP5_PYXAD|nr:TPA: hypothetical protein GDO54_017001 [Pyxicephalus adspersus]
MLLCINIHVFRKAHLPGKKNNNKPLLYNRHPLPYPHVTTAAPLGMLRPLHTVLILCWVQTVTSHSRCHLGIGISLKVYKHRLLVKVHFILFPKTLQQRQHIKRHENLLLQWGFAGRVFL